MASSSSFPPPRAPQGRAGLWLALVAAALVFLPALSGEFVLDDIPAVTRSTCVTGSLSLAEIFGRNFWCQPPEAATVDAWRPLPVLAWWAAWQLGSGSPLPFHLLPWFGHLGCVALVWRLARRLELPGWGPGLAALWFAIMPIHADAVASVVGLADVLSTLGVLMLALACVGGGGRARAVLALSGSALAIGAKESGAIVAALAVLAWVLGQRGEDEDGATAAPGLEPWVAGGVVLITALALTVRAQVLGGWTAQHLTFGVNPLIEASPLVRVTAPFGLWTRYLQVAALGTPLSADHSFDAIALSGGRAWLYAILGLITVIALAWVGIHSWRRRSARTLLIAWLLGAGALSCQLFTLLPALYAERLFYGASAPLALLCAGLLAPLLAERVAVIGLVAYFALQATLCGAHAWAWASEDGITAISVASAPRSARAQVWRARVLLRAGEPEQALVHADAAAEIYAAWGVPDALAGSALDSLGRPSEAAARFARATQLAPGEGEVADLAIQFLLRYGHRPQAQAIYARHVQARGGAPVAWVTQP